jgi:uncharacterized protein (DUF1800 family)
MGSPPVSIDRDLKASIAVTRFGLGAKPGEIDRARADPAGFLKAQIRAEGADQPPEQLESSAERIVDLRQFQTLRRDARRDGDPKTDPVKQAQVMLRDSTGEEFLARARLASLTDTGFRERWALFWFNHFTVSAVKLQTAVVVGPFEREAIRPHVFGRFEDLLLASTMHPAMLMYLDQAQSVGPDSQVAARRQMGAQGPRALAGLNENLAREIMELHTLGVGSGYAQTDVTEFARALTGWSVVGPNEQQLGGGFGPSGQPGEFAFRPAFHEPGARYILGKTYDQPGGEQAHAVLRDLAANPATARHIATKLARHFVADDPPPSLVAKLERSFSTSGGRLDKVAQTLIDAPESWVPDQRKFKTPYEFLISSYRATNQAPTALPQIAPVLNSMGQKAFSAPSPKGWAEEAGDWASPDGIVKRMGWSEAFAAAAPADASQPMQLAQNALGARLMPATMTAISRAETRPEAVSILLMSPEFQRR